MPWQSIDGPGETVSGEPRHDPAVGLAQSLIPRGHPISVVPAEKLVGPFSDQYDLDVLFRPRGDEVEWNTRGEGDRFILMPDEARQRSKELLRSDHHFVMLRPDGSSGQPGITQLISFSIREADRERLDRLLDHGSHERGQSGGVDPSGKEKSDRYVAHQVTAHRVTEPVA